MSKSLSLRRILALVITCVMLSAIVTLGVYSVVSPRIFAQAKLGELYPRAQFLAERVRRWVDSVECVQDAMSKFVEEDIFAAISGGVTRRIERLAVVLVTPYA